MIDSFDSRTKRYVVVTCRALTTGALVFVATLAAGLYFTENVLTKTYSATAVMEIQPKGSVPAEGTEWAFASPGSKVMEAELESIESPEVLRAVITNLGLERTWAERLFKRSDPLDAVEAMHHLESSLRLNFKHGTNVVEVRATSDDPKEASEIANAVVNAYKIAHEPQGESADGKPSLPVQILAQATIPEEPSRPNKRLCDGIAFAVAAMLSVMIASALEVCMLIARAEETARELEPVH
jgi:uncharacterized protein involved in exopolysaccharide biosynthesis